MCLSVSIGNEVTRFSNYLLLVLSTGIFAICTRLYEVEVVDFKTIFAIVTHSFQILYFLLRIIPAFGVIIGYYSFNV